MLGKFNSWAIVLAIAASLLIGFTLSTLAYRYHYLRVPGQSVVARMNRDLNLTPAEREQILEIMRDTRMRVRQSRRHFQREHRSLLLGAYGQIRATLTPQQQRQFDREFALPAMRESAAVPESPSSTAAEPTASAAQP